MKGRRDSQSRYINFLGPHHYKYLHVNIHIDHNAHSQHIYPVESTYKDDVKVEKEILEFPIVLESSIFVSSQTKCP